MGRSEIRMHLDVAFKEGDVVRKIVDVVDATFGQGYL
jgi:hypothetical protein